MPPVVEALVEVTDRAEPVVSPLLLSAKVVPLVADGLNVKPADPVIAFGPDQ